MKKAKCIVFLVAFLFIISSSQPVLAMQAQPADWKVSKTFVLTWTFIFGAALSAYYSAVDANKQSMDAKDWNFDFVTQAVTAFRTVYFLGINYYEKSYIPEQASLIADEAASKAYSERMHTLLQFMRTPLAMLSYNARFDEVVVKRYNDKYDLIKGFYDSYTPSWYANTVGHVDATLCAATYMLFNNVLFFLVLTPPLGGKLSSMVQRNLWLQDNVAKMVYHIGLPSVLAYTAYALWDIVLWNINMSVKSVFFGILPAPADNRFFRFPDCTACFFGTNLLGKSGPVARILLTPSKIERDEL